MHIIGYLGSRQHILGRHPFGRRNQTSKEKYRNNQESFCTRDCEFHLQKNDFEECRNKLKELGVWDYFVFPSIDWTPKVSRVMQIIQVMKLRPANVLFLDDEPANLQRILKADAAVMCSTAQELVHALEDQVTYVKEDSGCRRLQQYHDLEKKHKERAHFDSDEEFLNQAGIKIYICESVLEQIDRVCELINRTNQLNYTKKRVDKTELKDLLGKRDYTCAFISCRDKFSDYGIVGFYALNIQENRLEHFLFSCRTIGMGVEQFVYARLQYPGLTVQGEVVTPLYQEGCPDWITEVDRWKEKQSDLPVSNKILVKGPCDVVQIIPFFADSSVFETEFAYISQAKKGMYIESFNHSSQILASAKLPERDRMILADMVPFIDPEYYRTSIFKVKK